jgi:hypothetical protein
VAQPITRPKGRNTTRWIVGILAAITLGVVFYPWGVERITPWVEYEQSGPFLDAPHMLMIGHYKGSVRVKRGFFWHTIYSNTGNSSGAAWNRPFVFDGGHAILMNVYPNLMIYREGAEFPAYLDFEGCLLHYWSFDRRRVVCMTFGLTGVGRNALISRIQLDFHDTEGKIARQVTGVIPPELYAHFHNTLHVSQPILLGYDRDGLPVVGTTQFTESVKRYQCAAVTIGPAGMREVERKAMSESGLCPRDARQWAVIRNGGVVADIETPWVKE